MSVQPLRPLRLFERADRSVVRGRRGVRHGYVSEQLPYLRCLPQCGVRSRLLLRNRRRLHGHNNSRNRRFLIEYGKFSLRCCCCFCAGMGKSRGRVGIAPKRCRPRWHDQLEHSVYCNASGGRRADCYDDRGDGQSDGFADVFADGVSGGRSNCCFDRNESSDGSVDEVSKSTAVESADVANHEVSDEGSEQVAERQADRARHHWKFKSPARCETVHWSRHHKIGQCWPRWSK
mmetsp:Transcript_12180/g.22018  ORF Transcript_12180/g.22018 Transcript_12180/m.22018 type:complete len:233 (+) Transcript_12180:697-1395(+)